MCFHRFVGALIRDYSEYENQSKCVFWHILENNKKTPIDYGTFLLYSDAKNNTRQSDIPHNNTAKFSQTKRLSADCNQVNGMLVYVGPTLFCSDAIASYCDESDRHKRDII